MAKIITVEIDDKPANKREGVSQKTGKQYSISSQGAWMDFGHGRPEYFDLTLDPLKTPYAPGLYVLAAGALRPSRTGFGLEMTRYPELVPIQAAAQEIVGLARPKQG